MQDMNDQSRIDVVILAGGQNLQSIPGSTFQLFFYCRIYLHQYLLPARVIRSLPDSTSPA